jgi:hypothetical protein
MATTKIDLAERIKRRLGYPMVKVELDITQIYDAIDYAREKWMKWAVGNATQEVYFTKMILAGQQLYDLPTGLTELIAWDSHGSQSGINTLFTMDNFFYNQGMYDALLRTGGDGYTLISYHIARDFMETLARYTPDKYNWKYHRYTNQLEIHPPPPSGYNLIIGDTSYDSPGFVMLRGFMIEGSSLSTTWESGDSDTDFYTSSWILDRAEAQCKVTLGRIRQKFSNFASIGNVGISLDGDQLISEGREDIERLDTALKEEEVYEGLGIEIG